LYLVLTVLSTGFVQPVFDKAWQGGADSRAREVGAKELQIKGDPAWSNDGEFGYFVFDFGPRDTVPIVLIHGTPGAAVGLDKLAEQLGEDRRVIWFDLPGFASQSLTWNRYTDFSAHTYSDVTLAILDKLDVERAHIVGWSNGGAVALYLASEHPDRVASITLLASVGAQETEGSGSHFFEQAKYKLGDVVLNKLDVLIPHFGLLGPAAEREAFIRNFDDTDQRELTEIMPTITAPALILHGRNDFLVADWAAERHHELMPTSTLIMTEHDHFMPMLEPEETAGYIASFVARHDTPGVPPSRAVVDEAPRRTPFGETGRRFLDAVRYGHWLWVVAAVALGAVVLRRLGEGWAAVLVGATELDIGLAWVGLTVASVYVILRRGRAKHPGAWIAAVFKPGVVLVAGLLLTQLALRPIGLALGEVGWALAVFLMAILIEVGFRPLTREGRLALRIQWQRLRNHEWWPTWAIHGAAMPVFVMSAIRHRHPLVFTCCNPGIEAGGGFAGESKTAILTGLNAVGGEAILHFAAVPAGPVPAERAELALRQIATRPELGGYPIILKPDRGEHGKGVRLCRSESDVCAFFENFPGDAIAQRYHPGPMEAGIFWVRTPGAGGEHAGRLFSAARKLFPELTCDGVHTLGALIDAHPRFRIQRHIFRKRFSHRLDDVPEAGAVIRLSPAGNHAQGALFLDAPELITPGLEAEIDRLARGFRGVGGGELDIGRFDVRFASEDDLRAGRNFGIVEINGVTGESLNIYDPTKPVAFAWRTISAQWRLACKLGAWRMKRGARPLSVYEIVFGTRRHLRSRSTYAPAS